MMTTTRAVKIAGMGKALPPRVVTSAELEQRLGLEPGWIETRTGVRERRHVVNETASQLGAEAVLRALNHADRKLHELDLILCAAGSSEQTIPCTAALIQRQLGSPVRGVPCFDVNATCLSFLVGLDVAAAFVASGAYRRVAVVSPEVASPAIDWSEPESSVLMGDGAAAAIVEPSEDGKSSMMPARIATFSDGAEMAYLLGGGSRFHPNAPGTRPEMNLFHMKGPRIFRFTQREMVPFVERYLSDHGANADQFAAIVPHQASLFAVRATARACGFEPPQVLENIADHGNCVAASIPMVLYDAVRSGRVKRGDRLLLAGTAAGVSLGLMAMTF